MVSHNPTKFGDHRQCGNGDMFLVVKGQDSTKIYHYCLSLSKAEGLKAHVVSCY